MKICFISRFDSFASLALNYAILFRQVNWEVEFVVLDQQKLGQELWNSIKKRLDKNLITLVKYDKNIFIRNNVIFLSLTGGFIRKLFFENLQILNKKERPYLITAYPGVVYQNILDGLASRSFCDLIILPSKRELKYYDSFVENYNLEKAGFVGGYFKKKSYGGLPFINDIVFAEQTVVPNTVFERLYLAKKLIEIAKANEQRNLYVKPRIPIGGNSLFETKLHIIEALQIASGHQIPENLIISFKPIEYFTSQGATCMTISSTAAIETLQFHEKLIFITDFGPSENNGGLYFHDSGLEYKFSEIIAGVSKQINKEWKDEIYCPAEEQFARLIDRIMLDLRNNVKLGLRNTTVLYSTDYLCQRKQRIPKTFGKLQWLKRIFFNFSR